VILLALVLVPAPAGAHTIGPRFAAVFDGTEPPHPDVAVETADTGAMPHVTLRVPGVHVIELTGPLREPFVRVEARGAFVNAASPSATLLEEQVKLPARAPDRPPRWVRRTSSRSISWFEPRAEYPYKDAPAVVRKRGKRATVYRWSIAGTYDGTPMDLRGHVDWVPAPFDPTSVILLGAAVLGLLYVLVGGRRRARKASP
jgi:hypothetical protein